jgi:hypothetical protein
VFILIVIVSPLEPSIDHPKVTILYEVYPEKEDSAKMKTDD